MGVRVFGTELFAVHAFLGLFGQVRQWVVIDDINMADADTDRKPGTLLMSPRIVRTSVSVEHS